MEEKKPLILSNNICDQTYRRMKGSSTEGDTVACLQHLLPNPIKSVATDTSSLGYLFRKLEMLCDRHMVSRCFGYTQYSGFNSIST